MLKLGQHDGRLVIVIIDDDDLRIARPVKSLVNAGYLGVILWKRSFRWRDHFHVAAPT